MLNQKISNGTVHKMVDDLKAKLLNDANAFDAWESLTPLARNEWLCWVISVKKIETRNDHIKRLINDLKNGKRRPCCWIGCIHRKDKEVSPSIKAILKIS